MIEFLKPVAVVLIPFAIIMLLNLYIGYKQYIKTHYFKTTNTRWLKVRFDKGLFGEYLTSRYLEKIEGKKELFYNVYLPKNGEETTEVDLIMIHHSGIYVFESKNYSGWIFGNEKNKNWTQSLNKNTKKQFYNPIWQNRTHIKYLKNCIPDIGNNKFHSIIVFSERCELKKVTLQSTDIKVIKRNELKRANKVMDLSKNILTENDIQKIKISLEKYTNVSNEIKQKHIDNINMYVQK